MKKTLSFINRVWKADIIRVFSFTAMSTLVRMLTSLISVKVIATIIGPSGIALLGQLNNFSSIIMTTACGGINSGVTKYIAEYKESEEKIKILLSTALRITICCSALSGIFMVVFNRFLSTTIMLSPNYGYVFVIFGLTVFFYALNMLISSVLNGYKEFKKFVSVNIIGSLLGLIFTLYLVFTWGLKGAIISAVTFQSIMFFVSLWMIRRLSWANLTYFKQKFNNEIAKKFFQYSLMTIVIAATGPVSQLLLRGYIISNISTVQAGWWEAMNRISNIYLMVITASFGVYYLPKLSEIRDNAGLKHEIFKAYKVIMPILVIGLTLVYLLRIFVVRILFTQDFLPMEKLFIWQLFGDFFKIASWLLSYLMVAKSMTKAFIIIEVLFSSLFVFLGSVFININGVVGITQAYLINYIFYFIIMIILFRKLLFIRV